MLCTSYIRRTLLTENLRAEAHFLDAQVVHNQCRYRRCRKIRLSNTFPESALVGACVPCARTLMKGFFSSLSGGIPPAPPLCSSIDAERPPSSMQQQRQSEQQHHRSACLKLNEHR